MNKHISNQNPLGDGLGIGRRHFVKIAGITTLGVSSLGFSGIGGFQRRFNEPTVLCGA